MNHHSGILKHFQEIFFKLPPTVKMVTFVTTFFSLLGNTVLPEMAYIVIATIDCIYYTLKVYYCLRPFSRNMFTFFNVNQEQGDCHEDM